MRFQAVLLRVVLGEIALEPAIGLRLSLWFVEVIKRLVRLLDGAERAFDLALGPCRRTPAVLASREMGQNRHPEMLHHAAEDGTFDDGAIVRIDRRRDALERRAILLRLWRHRIEQKAQRRLDILAVDLVVLLVGDAAAVVDGAVDHQGGSAAAGFDPGGAVNLLQVGGAQIEMPQRIAVLGLPFDKLRSAPPPAGASSARDRTPTP